MTTAAELASYASSFPSFRNRIINGDMRIDQRNAGGSITLNSTVQYTVDRIPTYKGTSSAIITAQQSTTAPAKFVNSVIFTVSTGATPSIGDINGFWQVIEGSNVADLGWGTANAQTVTLSFWVRSSVTGTYSVSFTNSSSNRFYVATYSISSANTWEKKTITVAGDTDISATWATDNTGGIQIVWDLGYGTDFNGTAGSWSASTIRRTSDSVQWCATTGATFYITGVQLEEGTVATPFEHRPYGIELALCQRYYQARSGTEINAARAFATDIAVRMNVFLINPMRANPSVTLIGSTGWSVGGSPGGITNDYFRISGNSSSEAYITGYTANAEL